MGSRDAGTPDGAQNCTNNPLKSLLERPGTLGSGGGVPTQHSDIIDKKHQKRPGTPGTPSANEGGAENKKLRELAQWLRYGNDMNESRVRLIQPVPVGVPGVLSAIQKMSFSAPTMVQSGVPGVLGRSGNDINELTEGAGRSTGRSGAFHPPTEAEARRDGLELASDRAADISLPSPPPIDELRARLALADADPERAGDYLYGKASVVLPAAAPPVDGSPDPTPLPVPADLINRLAAILARPAPWQRVIELETAMPYFQARARATLAPLNPLARGLLVAAKEARAGVPSKPPSQWLAQSPPDTGHPGRGSITLGAAATRTAVLAVACTQCSRSGRSRISTLIEQHGVGCAIPELRRVLVNDCPKRGNAHGGCDVWFPELPGLFRGDDGGSGGMRPALGIQDTLGSPCD
jgi:hypothetical protein